jgi:hypothetical protein
MSDTLVQQCIDVTLAHQKVCDLDALDGRVNKAKLVVYVALLQRDKDKCRNAIDAFVELAQEALANAMAGEVKLVVNTPQGVKVYDEGTDGAAHQLGGSLKCSILTMEYLLAERT